MMSKSKMGYIFQVPAMIPAKKVLVHNLISHDRNTVPGTNGFRAWFDALHSDYDTSMIGHNASKEFTSLIDLREELHLGMFSNTGCAFNP
jgi:hypothetical protein